MQHAGDRRPIAARNLALSGRAAEWLVRHRASPNGISLAGMGCGLLAGLCFALTATLPAQAWPFWLAGAALVQLRLLANLFDGMVAIGRGIASPLGELFNEVPDRVSDSAVLIGLGYAAGGLPWLGYAAALAAMATAYVRAVGKAAGAPSDFRGPMAKQQRMALCTALAAWCALVPPGWEAPGGWPLVTLVLAAITLLSLLTAWRRLSGTAAALRAGAR